jgi:hypothetical protein
VGPRVAARPSLRPAFLSILNYRTANCPRIAAPHYVGVERPAALFYISAQPKPSIFGWLFITHLLLVINGELGQFALYHQHFMFTFAFPAVPHSNNQHLRATCSIIHRVRAQLAVRHLHHVRAVYNYIILYNLGGIYRFFRS